MTERLPRRKNGLASARGSGEVEGETEAGGMPFPETPTLEYQIMLCNLGQRCPKSAVGRGRQNNIVESPARRDGLDCASAIRAKKTRK